MKLFDTLKQFKNIKPDAEFSQHSRAEILLSPQGTHRTMSGIFSFLHVLEIGAAVALAGFFILILTGSFSPTRSIAPIQYAVIDPAGLHAEAQAIDMQIKLANINYPQTNSGAESTVALTIVKNSLSNALAAPAASSATGATSTATSTAASAAATSTAPSSTLSVDQALTQLAK